MHSNSFVRDVSIAKCDELLPPTAGSKSEWNRTPLVSAVSRFAAVAISSSESSSMTSSRDDSAGDESSWTWLSMKWPLWIVRSFRLRRTLASSVRWPISGPVSSVSLRMFDIDLLIGRIGARPTTDSVIIPVPLESGRGVAPKTTPPAGIVAIFKHFCGRSRKLRIGTVARWQLRQQTRQQQQ